MTDNDKYKDLTPPDWYEVYEIDRFMRDNIGHLTKPDWLCNEFQKAFNKGWQKAIQAVKAMEINERYR